MRLLHRNRTLRHRVYYLGILLLDLDHLFFKDLIRDHKFDCSLTYSLLKNVALETFLTVRYVRNLSLSFMLILLGITQA